MLSPYYQLLQIITQWDIEITSQEKIGKKKSLTLCN